MNLIQVSAAVMIDEDGRILLGKRPEGTFMAGYWEFPGGKIEPDETPEGALQREIEEELGVELGCFWPFTFLSETREEHHVVVLVFICREWEGIIKAKNHQELKWVRVNELDKVENMLPSNKPLITALRDYLSPK